MKKEITFEQAIGLLDVAINITKAPSKGVDIKLRNTVNTSSYKRLNIAIIDNSTSEFGYDYIIIYTPTEKEITLLDEEKNTSYTIHINNYQEDCLYDRINKLVEAINNSSIDKLNNFISNYASKK